MAGKVRETNGFNIWVAGEPGFETQRWFLDIRMWFLLKSKIIKNDLIVSCNYQNRPQIADSHKIDAYIEDRPVKR